MNKKIKNIALTILFAFTLIFVGKVLVDAVVNNNEGKITVNKTAVRKDAETGDKTSGRNVDVTLSVTGNEFTTSSTLDVVLVIDRSGSMDEKASEKDKKTKMQATKTSAKSLVEKLLENNTEDRTVVKMGIVTFGTDVIDGYTEKGTYRSLTSTSLTASSSTITTMINNIPDSVYNQGTNIQSGLERARTLLKDSEAKNKVVILLTDGEPTFFNYEGYDSPLGNGRKDTAVTVCTEYKDGKCNEEKEIKPSEAAKNEATNLKDDNVTIYTVGFGISENKKDDEDTKEAKKNARDFLQKVATKTTTPYYLLAENADELENSFNDIIKSITTIANNVVVTDTVPAGFTVNETELKNTYGDKVTVKAGEKGTTIITWNINELTVTEDQTLTYELTAKDDYYGGMYTNASAVLTGDAVKGNPSYPDGEINEVFPLPIVAISRLTKSDNYTVKLGDTLNVNSDKGILANDAKIKTEDGAKTEVTDEIIIKSASCGSTNDLKVNEDGSFSYTPTSDCYNEKNTEVIFEYEVKSKVKINGKIEEVVGNNSKITIKITKDEPSLKDSTVTKTNTDGNTTTSIEGPFNYKINYSTTIENHIGTTTITIVDELPYELDETKNNNLANGTYNDEDKTITWVEVIKDIDSYKNKNNSINIEKDITVYYKNINTDVDTITNNVKVTSDIDNKTIENNQETKVIRGNIKVNYVDSQNNTLLPSINKEGLINTEYKTTAEDIINIDEIEYQLVATKINGEKIEKTNKYSGVYKEEDTTITYVYYKVNGNIDKDNTLITKEGPDKVTSSNSEFDYTINYQTKIDNYIGDATVTIVDTLPLSINEELSKLDGGKYNPTDKTITWTIKYEDINTYENSALEINITKKIKVVFNELDANERTLINKVNSKVETSKSEFEKETSETTKLEIKGTVISHYVDVNNKTLLDDITTKDLVGNEYTTTPKNISDYLLVDTKGNTTGIYIDGTIEVTYIYYKVEGNISADSIIKKGTSEVTSVTDTFEYKIIYNATIDDYIGNATVTIIDTLPLPINEKLSNIADGKYEYKDGIATITWTEEIKNIDTNTSNEPHTIGIEKNISIVYDGLNPTTRELTNKVIGKVETEVSEHETKPAEKTTSVKVEGTVISHYIDTNGNALHKDNIITGLVGNDYTTTAETINDYQLVETKGNTTGKYIDGTIEVTYIYYKVVSNIAYNTVIKTGTEEVDSVTDTFEYKINYKTTIDDYIGDAIVTIIDTLPLSINEKLSNLAGGKYEYKDGIATITWTEEIKNIDTNKAKEAYEVAITKEISVVYEGLNPTTREITNKVYGKVKTNIKEETTKEVEKTTSVKVEGKVISHYIDTNGNTIHKDNIITGLVGNEYTTTAETINDYQLVDTKGNTTGKYIDGTIEVTYIYYKETGKIPANSIKKTGTEEVDSIIDTFKYKITHNATIEDYIGNAKVTIIDTLPLLINEELSNLDGGKYEYKDGIATITWTEEIKNIDTNKTNKPHAIKIEKNISIVYEGLNPTTRELTNKVIGKVETEVSEHETKPDEQTTSVKVEGTVISHYIDTDGNTISEDTKATGLVGNEYTTESKDLVGYQLVDTKGDTTGKYIDGTLEVTYIYYKETGRITNETLEKTGDKTITLNNSKVNYSINYKSEINNYIGNATITIIDYLPQAIDVTESILDGGIYDEENLTITWKINVSEINTYTSGESYKINLNKNLLLAYKNLDLTANKITNKVSVNIKTEVSEENNTDEFTTEINVKGIVIVNYVDEEGNNLQLPITLTGKVGTNYLTEEKVFVDYILKEINGEPTGIYTDGITEITYIYSKLGKGGDVEILPPQTGVKENNNNFISTILIALLLFIKNLFK